MHYGSAWLDRAIARSRSELRRHHPCCPLASRDKRKSLFHEHQFFEGCGRGLSQDLFHMVECMDSPRQPEHFPASKSTGKLSTIAAFTLQRGETSFEHARPRLVENKVKKISAMAWKRRRSVKDLRQCLVSQASGDATN